MPRRLERYARRTGNTFATASLVLAVAIGAGAALGRAPSDPPRIVEGPADPTTTSSARVLWRHDEPSARFACQVDDGPWQTCASPYRFTVAHDAARRHRFSVRAASPGEPWSRPAVWAWSIARFPLEISGSASGLVPGVWVPVEVAIANPNHHTVDVTDVDVAVATSPQTCAAAENVEVRDAPIGDDRRVPIPASATVALRGDDRPSIRLRDLPDVNQDGCKGARFGLAFSAVATR